MSTTVTMTGLLDAEYFDVQSESVEDTFRIFVAKPPFVPPGKYPAIYVADGNGSFLLATAIQRMLSLGAECPPAYVIGIGYPTESGFVTAMAKRNRDYAHRWRRLCSRRVEFHCGAGRQSIPALHS